MSGSPAPDERFPEVAPRRVRGGPVVPLVLIAGAMTMISQVDAFASFAAVFWLVGFALIMTALVVAVKEWRRTRRTPH